MRLIPVNFELTNICTDHVTDAPPPARASGGSLSPRPARFRSAALVMPPVAPRLPSESERAAAKINQRDLINLAPTHASNLQTRQAINSANYLLLLRGRGNERRREGVGERESDHMVLVPVMVVPNTRQI